MPVFPLFVLLLASDAPKVEAPIRVVARPWAPFISPMGEPFRSTSAGDDPLARWFHKADRDGDGALNTDEMVADAVRFFVTLDGNQDGVIDPEELAAYESDVAPEVQVNSKWKLTREESARSKARPESGDGGKSRRRQHDDIDGYQVHGLQGAARYGLLNLPEPVAGADEDFNRGITLDEFRRTAGYRFRLLDAKGAGRLTLQDLEPLLPTRPNHKKLGKVPREEPKDTRLGQPFPRGD